MRDISASEERTVSNSGASKTSQQAETNYIKGTASEKKQSAFLLGKESVTEWWEGFFCLSAQGEQSVTFLVPNQ